MIDFNIGINKYSLPTEWDEITLSKAIELHSIALKTIPKDLTKRNDIILSATTDVEDEVFIEWEQGLHKDYLSKQLPQFSKEILSVFGVESDVLDSITKASLVAFYEKYCDFFVFGILNNGKGYRHEYLDTFSIDGTEYLLQAAKTVGNEVIPMYDITTIQFTECADILKLAQTNYNLIKFFLSTVTIGNDYDEDTVLDNAKKFDELTMDVVFDCIEEFQQFHAYCYKAFPNLFKVGKVSTKAKLSNSWRSFILDLHIKSNYQYKMEDIEAKRVLDIFEVADRDSEVMEYQRKINE